MRGLLQLIKTNGKQGKKKTILILINRAFPYVYYIKIRSFSHIIFFLYFYNYILLYKNMKRTFRL